MLGSVGRNIYQSSSPGCNEKGQGLVLFAQLSLGGFKTLLLK